MKCIWCRQQFHSFSSYLNLIRVDNGSSINMNISVTWKHKVIVSAYCHLYLFDYCSLQFSLAFMGYDQFFSHTLPFLLSSQTIISLHFPRIILWSLTYFDLCLQRSPGKFRSTKFHSLIFLVHLGSIAHHICQLNM
jgi:hypothetical protein